MTRGLHDLICLQIEDKAEKTLPNMGLLPVKHPETGETKWLDTSSKRVREEHEASYVRLQNSLETMFLKMKLDTIRINTNDSYVKPLVSFFQRRIHRG
jgi:hypothetical protein